ncbi:hypothetical protein EMMF5_001425 [Cystobasidiomycetes sp. EMM_F5]
MRAQGHEVTGLARSDASENVLKEMGVKNILRGTTTTLDVLRQGAAEADAVIHAAFDHDAFATGKIVQACAEDRDAIQAMCEALLASTPSGDKPKAFIYTSGLLGNVTPDETSEKVPNEHIPRHLSELLVHSYSAKGVRSIVVRLSPVVHGPNHEHLFITLQAAAARKHGFVAYVDDGQQYWPSVHVNDTAQLLTLALTKAPSGSYLHNVAENVTVKTIADRIGEILNLPTKSIDAKDAFSHYQGFMGGIMQASMEATSELTRKWTGWEPKGYNLAKEMEGYTLKEAQA